MENAEYLNLLERPLDNQQLAACCSENNTIVAAGAGSGKTQVLATRFAYLVMSKNIDVDKILTLTFTNKAASEMYERIYSHLVFFSKNEKVPEVERNRAKIAVEKFYNAHIQTLDSYCSSIVKQVAPRYGISPDFTTGSQDSLSEIKNLAMPFVLKYKDDKTIQFFSAPGRIDELAYGVFAKTINKCTSIADKNGKFKEILQRQVNEIVSTWNKKIDEIESVISNIHAVYEELPEKALTQKFPQNVNATFSKEPKFFNIAKEQVEDNSLVNQFNPISEYLESFSGLSAKGKISELIQPLKEQVQLIRSDGGLSQILLSIIEYITEYEYIKRLYELLDEFLEIVNNNKRKSLSLSFSDVSELALLALKENEDIRLQESSLFEKIMIDEFQDNNKKNKELLFLLASDENHELLNTKLFFVGDEKQSIYKFRGADVSTFKNLQEELNVPLFPMQNNYRTDSDLLKSFNLLFGGYEGLGPSAQRIEELPSVFPNKADAPFEAVFTENASADYFSDNEEKHNKALGQKQDIKMHACMYNKNIDLFLENTKATTVDEVYYKRSKDQMAFFIASKIKKLHANGVSYKDIAILDKSRTDRSVLSKYLANYKIPYTVDVHKNIFSSTLINDIYSVLRLTVYPSDVNAFAVFLCSPFVGLFEEDVETILAITYHPNKSVFEPFKDSVLDDKELSKVLEVRLSARAYEKFNAGKSFYEAFTTFALSESLTNIVSYLWYDCGHRFETLWSENAMLDSELYDFLFELARVCDSEDRSLSWFVDNLATQRSTLFSGDDSDIDVGNVEYPTEENDAVQIMTIHKSKGLQFNVVFVYGATGHVDADRGEGSIYISEDFGVSINIQSKKNNYFFIKQKEIEQRKNDAEFRRLFYVAITRAINEVFIVGDWSYPKNTPPKEDYRFNFDDIIRFYYPNIDKDSEYARSVDNPEIPVYDNNSPFDYISILPKNKEIVFDSDDSNLKYKKNTIDDKLVFLQKATKLYKDVNTITTEVNTLKRFSPSSLEKFNLVDGRIDFSSTNDFSDEVITQKGSTELFKGVPVTNSFGPKEFGTLCHAYMEALINGIAPSDFIPPYELISAVEKIDELKNACVELSSSFANSEIYKEVTTSDFKKTEYSFLANIQGFKVTGSIDLLFQDTNGVFTIVDYKTDVNIKPEKYYLQLSCYRKAASYLCSQIKGSEVAESEIKCYLFYLRHGKEIEITENIPNLDDIDLKSAINSL